MIFLVPMMRRNEANETKHAGRCIESALDAADRQAATTCLRLTHDGVFDSAREALRDRQAKQETVGLDHSSYLAQWSAYDKTRLYV